MVGGFRGWHRMNAASAKHHRAARCVARPSERATRMNALLATIAKDTRRPTIVGYVRARPVWAIGGADDTATTTLEQERTALLARLDDPALTPEQRTEATTQAVELQGRIDAHNTATAAANTARAALLGSAVAVRVAPAAPAPGAPQPVPANDPTDPRLNQAAVAEARESLGHHYLRLARGAEGDPQRFDAIAEYVARGCKGTSAVVNVPGEIRALFATTNNPMNFPRYPDVTLIGDQALQVLDLIDRQPMTSTSIEWIQETTSPTAAVEVTEGAAKPESTFSLTLVTDTAATIAHWVSITRQALADDSMLRGYIEGRLTYGLMKRLNGQILNGNGTPPNLKGILATSGIGIYTAGTAAEASILSIRKAKTVAQLSEYDPDGVVMNPVDWEAVELSADTTGQWRLTASAAAGAPPRVWGLAVVSTTAILGTVFGTTGGTFLVGAFRTGATLWERTGVDIYISDSHASTFISNILTLLAEVRAALTVWRPKAFVKGTFGASRT